jgi:peptidoglycan lytic transglycosylase
MRRAALGWACVLLVGCGGAARTTPSRPAAAAPPTQKAAALPPPDTLAGKRSLFAQAHDRIAARQYAEAIRLLEPLCPAYVDLADYCLHYLALSRARSGDDAGADALWAQLAATHPQSLFAPRANLERARLRRTAGDLTTARALLAAARAGEDEGVAGQALLELAAVDRADGNPGAAYDDLTAARTRAPGTPLGREAKRRIMELRQQYPDLEPHGAALEAELRLLIKEGDYAAARAAADRLLASAPIAERPQLLRLRADAELGGGQTELGLATLQDIVRQYPASAAAPEAQWRYASLLWNRDRNDEARAAFLEFRRRYPGHPRMPGVIYALARIAQGDGQSDEAVALYTALAESYATDDLAHEARWRIGWIYYQDGRSRDAAAAFERAARTAGGGPAADAEYWRARALERAGDPAAESIYRALIADAPASYYAHWCAQRLGTASTRTGSITAPGAPDAIGPPPPGTDPYHWVRADELRAVGLRPAARAELRAYERNTGDPPAALLAAYQAVDGYRDAIRLGSAHGYTDPAIFFPLAFWPQLTRQTGANGTDPLLVLALMRQESMFDPAARSAADARGLMQLLPSTAERTARNIGQPPPDGKLYDPDTNITLGVAHLQELLRKYQGDEIKALAAYNGGENAVAKWQTRFGHLPPDEFVESITYRETRDYVKRVLGNYRRYQMEYRSR